MSLLIEIKDGLPVNHPVEEANLINAFPNLDPEEKSLRFVPFKRNLKDSSVVLNFGQRWNCEYLFIDGIWQDVWTVVNMPQEELDQLTDEYLQSLIATISERSQLAAIELETETDEARIIKLQKVVEDLGLIDTNNKNLAELLDINIPFLPARSE